MKNIALVLGYGGGIGKHLFDELAEFDQKIAVSRSSANGNFDYSIQCDIKKFSDYVDQISGNVSLVVYVPSEFGESREVKLEEYDDFMETGPRGLLSCFHSLHENGKLAEDALFLSIGSTASSQPYFATAKGNPMYVIAKSAQKAIVAKLTGAYSQYRFATITLGGIQDGDEGVGYSNITKTIRHIYSMQNGVRYTDIELKSSIDIP